MDIIANIITQPSLLNVGYIAGSNDAIVTVNGQPSMRHIHVLDAINLTYIQHTMSLPNGHYMVRNLDHTKQYIVMCRDLPPTNTEQRYEPAVWDYVTPATDLTVQQQQELWESWQTK